MNPLTEQDIRSSFANASRRERTQAILPDLNRIAWESTDVLGWHDAKKPSLSYVVLPLDDRPVGLLLRSSDRSGRARRAAVCTWCEDVVETDDVSMYVARKAGAAGRRGDTLGTLICSEFDCSRHVRRKPTAVEAHSDDPLVLEAFVERRIQGLQERSQRFVRQVLATA